MNLFFLKVIVFASLVSGSSSAKLQSPSTFRIYSHYWNLVMFSIAQIASGTNPSMC